MHTAIAHADARHNRVRMDFASATARAVRQRVGEATGVDPAIGGDVRATHKIFVADDGTERERLAGREQFHLEAKRLGLGHQTPNLFHAERARGQAYASDLPPIGINVCFLPQSSIELHTVHDHPRQVVGAAQLADEPGSAVRRPAGELPSLDEDDVPPAHQGQVVGDTAARHAPADDDRLGFFTHDPIRFVTPHVAFLLTERPYGFEGLRPPPPSPSAKWDVNAASLQHNGTAAWGSRETIPLVTAPHAYQEEKTGRSRRLRERSALWQCQRRPPFTEGRECRCPKATFMTIALSIPCAIRSRPCSPSSGG